MQGQTRRSNEGTQNDDAGLVASAESAIVLFRSRLLPFPSPYETGCGLTLDSKWLSASAEVAAQPSQYLSKSPCYNLWIMSSLFLPLPAVGRCLGRGYVLGKRTVSCFLSLLSGLFSLSFPRVSELNLRASGYLVFSGSPFSAVTGIKGSAKLDTPGFARCFSPFPW